VSHVHSLPQVIDCHLTPMATGHERIESADNATTSIECEGNDGFELPIVHDRKHHDSEHEREARASNADRDDESSEPCERCHLTLFDIRLCETTDLLGRAGSSGSNQPLAGNWNNPTTAHAVVGLFAGYFMRLHQSSISCFALSLA